MVMLSGWREGGGGATPLVTGFPGVLNMRSVKEKVPLSTVSNLNLLSSFQAAVSNSNSLPATTKNSLAEGSRCHRPMQPSRVLLFISKLADQTKDFELGGHGLQSELVVRTEKSRPEHRRAEPSIQAGQRASTV